ncbi:MAG: hypothetical protein V7603_2498 [Micromonosporaceae bacterium]
MTGPSGCRLGIDFGTTHTVATLARPDGRAQPLLFASTPLLTSAVFADASGRLLTGADAQRSARLDPARFEPNVKRRVDDGAILLGGVEYPVVDVIAAVLRRVHDEAVRVAGGPLAQVVLTHPAGWGPARRGILSDAAARAGLGTVALVAEPLAAAAYFAGAFPAAPGPVLVVYDFGAGTFDVSVIERQPDGGWRVLASEGLDDVGGLDLDAEIVAHIGARLSRSDPERWQRLTDPAAQRDRWLLRDDVRGAKEQLSRTSSAMVRVPVFETDVPVTREEFEALARPWLERTVALTAAVLARARIRQPPALLLVGGSSRIPLVGTLLHQRLGVAPTVVDQPELVVAEGSLHAVPAPAAEAPAAELPTYEGPAPAHLPPRLVPVEPPPLVPVSSSSRPGRSGRRALTAALAAVAVLALAAAGIALATKLTGRRAGGGTPITAGGRLSPGPLSAAPSAGPSPSPSGVHVVYEVTASGSGNAGSVDYLDQDGQEIRRSGVPLPWRVEFTTGRPRPVLVLLTQRHSGGDGGPVTCRITANGKVISQTTATGRFAAPECSGSAA